MRARALQLARQRRRGKSRRTALWLSVVCATVTQLFVTTDGIKGQTTEVSSRLEANQQAKELANELVASVFNVQLRQLEENGLRGRPIYSEIVKSRDAIDQLASQDMESLSVLLESIHTASEADQNEIAKQSRVLARRIAVSMMAERQRLRSQLRASRKFVLLRQMIGIEKEAIARTKELKGRTTPQQRRLTTQIVESHLDQDVLLKQLVELLEKSIETNTQDRIALIAARDRIVKDDVVARNKSLPGLLTNADYEVALKNEQAILASLEALVQLLRSGDRLEEELRQRTIEAIEETISEQLALQKQSQSADLTNASAREDLASQQRQLAERVSRLRQPLEQLSLRSDKMRDASSDAKLAAEDLESRQKEDAVERQSRVLESLDELVVQLQSLNEDSNILAEQVSTLEELSSSLNDLVEKQAEVSNLTENDLEAAAKLEAEIGESLDEIDDSSRMNAEVEAELDKSQESVAQAQAALEDDSPSAEQSRLQAVENAERSLMEAAAQVQSELAKAQQAMEAANSTENDSPSDGTAKNEASSGTTRDSGGSAITERAVDVESRSFDNEAWFTRLPQDLQAKIRAATRRPPPRGYEQRLQRFFETTD